ncbi:bifunctional UDP-N-acetylglucosamine diphosphorylase/glucosamine-1-phosphate N-acetyltransferase GlmU [Myxococcota bacterium]|nr:bifunctional UDP-N-acetylglucosamine diphosphorylase/glucosamine-1-phosphate N-acetyltransferase GlmU [Myxococcota bacterium]MBU1535346.1 bifunctional UDP-N-acetylglucosamine diphosphorylase/glucosamine-1-phosphate N-acetyltransferase GlmU [Myxococcota bacterium]
MEPFAALVLAAGKSTRMKSQTSKLLHSVAGMPIIQRVARLVGDLGAEKVALVVSHQKEAIFSAFSEHFPGAFMVDQGDPRGTGHAVQKGMEVLVDFPGDVLILAGDVPLLRLDTLRRFVDLHRNSAALLSVMTMEPAEPHGYGRMVRHEQTGRVERIVEQRDLPEHLLGIEECNGGIYLVKGTWLQTQISRLGTDNSQRELYLTDLVEMVPKNEVITTLLVPEEELLGVNTRGHLAQAEAVAQKRLSERHMAGGVTFTSPGTVSLHEMVTIGKDTIIHNGVSLRGTTSVGEACVIDQGSVLTDAVVADHVIIKPYTVVERSTVESRGEIGPFSHLRPHTLVMSGARVGNFVECKKTTLREGVKANHLSYLGDADVGAGSNIGAGTITCNYDGKNKFQTIIEEGVFIGSDSQLIAPVRVGAGAYVGTGTTVFSDVPPGALAVNPKKQHMVGNFIPPKERNK